MANMLYTAGATVQLPQMQSNNSAALTAQTSVGSSDSNSIAPGSPQQVNAVGYTSVSQTDTDDTLPSKPSLCCCGYQTIIIIFLLYTILGTTFLLYQHFFIQKQCECSVSTLGSQPPSNPLTNQTLSPTTSIPTYYPTIFPTPQPTAIPTDTPSIAPSTEPTPEPSAEPSAKPSAEPSAEPSPEPTAKPSLQPTHDPDGYKNYIGDFKISAQGSTHGYWKLCDGSYLDPAVYPDLFSFIGYSFGSSGILFALPNPMDSVMGITGADHDIGDYVGSETNVLLERNIPSHYHLTARYNTPIPNCPSNSFDPSPDLYAAAGCVDTQSNPIESVQLLVPTDQAPDWGRSSVVGNGDSFSVMQPTLYTGNLFIYTGVSH